MTSVILDGKPLWTKRGGLFYNAFVKVHQTAVTVLLQVDGVAVGPAHR